jgi:hypothetical protein
VAQQQQQALKMMLLQLQTCQHQPPALLLLLQLAKGLQPRLLWTLTQQQARTKASLVMAHTNSSSS